MHKYYVFITLQKKVMTLQLTPIFNIFIWALTPLEVNAYIDHRRSQRNYVLQSNLIQFQGMKLVLFGDLPSHGLQLNKSLDVDNLGF